jgi:saccharopine dehydrogenase-like NADP-dependent oxidoreductase
MGLGDRDRVVELKDGTKVKPFDVIMAVVKRPVEGAFLSETRESISNARPMDRVIDMEVIGRKDGVAQRTLISWYHDDSPQLRLQLFETFGAVNIWVAVPMVVAAKMISRGQVPKGVVTPEGLDFELFFRELETMEYPLDVQEKCTLLPSA